MDKNSVFLNSIVCLLKAYSSVDRTVQIRYEINRTFETESLILSFSFDPTYVPFWTKDGLKMWSSLSKSALGVKVCMAELKKK